MMLKSGNLPLMVHSVMKYTTQENKLCGLKEDLVNLPYTSHTTYNILKSDFLLGGGGGGARSEIESQLA